MPTNSIFNTSTDKVGQRQEVKKEGDTTYYAYSDGSELRVEKTAGPGQDGRLKEVRTVTKAKIGGTMYATINYRDGQFEQIFRGKTEEEGD